MYIAVIGDIIGSRKIEEWERSRVQRELKRALNEANTNLFLQNDVVNRFKAKSELFEYEVESKTVITTGDEFQGLLKEGSNPLRFLRFIQTSLGDKTRIRWGIGKGGLATSFNPDEAVGMDGECFYNARDALDEAKRADFTCRARGFCDFDGKKDLDAVINMLLENLFLLYWDMPPKYRKIYGLHYIKGKSVEDIQRALGYSSNRYIYKALSDPRSKQMIRNELALADLFVYKDVKLPSVEPGFP